MFTELFRAGHAGAEEFRLHIHRASTARVPAAAPKRNGLATGSGRIAVCVQRDSFGKNGKDAAHRHRYAAQALDAPSIGLILCRQQRRFLVEYALRDLKRPIGLARWTTKITGALPRHLRGTLPTVRQLEAELQSLSGFAKDHAPAGAAAVSPNRPAKVRTRRNIRRTEVQQPWP